MAFDDRKKAAFDAASESVKQLLVLGTGSIGGAVALFDRDAPGISFGPTAGWIYSGLSILAVSVIFGLFALGCLAGQLGSPCIEEPTTYAKAPRLMMFIQMGGFGLGIAALVLAAILSPVETSPTAAAPPNPPPYQPQAESPPASKKSTDATPTLSAPSPPTRQD